MFLIQDVKKLLEQSLERVTIRKLSIKRLRYSKREDSVSSKNANLDTLAHELFREIDDI